MRHFRLLPFNFDLHYLSELYKKCKGSMRNQFLQKPQKIRLIAISL